MVQALVPVMVAAAALLASPVLSAETERTTGVRADLVCRWIESCSSIDRCSPVGPDSRPSAAFIMEDHVMWVDGIAREVDMFVVGDTTMFVDRDGGTGWHPIAWITTVSASGSAIGFAYSAQDLQRVGPLTGECEWSE